MKKVALLIITVAISLLLCSCTQEADDIYVDNSDVSSLENDTDSTDNYTDTINYDATISALEDEQIIVFFENYDVTFDFNYTSANGVNFTIISYKDLSSSNISVSSDIENEITVYLADETSNYESYPYYVIYEIARIDWEKYYELYNNYYDLHLEFTATGDTLSAEDYVAMYELVEKYREEFNAYDNIFSEIYYTTTEGYEVDYYIYTATLAFTDAYLNDFTVNEIELTIDDEVFILDIGEISSVTENEELTPSLGVLSVVARSDVKLEINSENKVMYFEDSFSVDDNDITITDIYITGNDNAYLTDISVVFTDNGIPLDYGFESGDTINIYKGTSGTFIYTIVDESTKDNLYIGRSYYFVVEYTSDGIEYQDTMQITARTRPNPAEIIAYVNDGIDFTDYYKLG